MINISVWSNTYIEIDSIKYEIETKEDLIRFIGTILDKVHYSGERICLESVEIKDNKNIFVEINRW